MPTYDYTCEHCGPFEKFQWMRDKPLTECPECSGNVVRMIGKGAGVIFKVAGFMRRTINRRKEDDGQAKNHTYEAPRE